MKVLIKKPGKNAVAAEIDNTLEALQEAVGGYIETVTIASDLTVICNEEGLIRHLPFNVILCGRIFCGTIILAGVRGDEFSDIPQNGLMLMRMFPQLWRHHDM